MSNSDAVPVSVFDDNLASENRNNRVHPLPIHRAEDAIPIDVFDSPADSSVVLHRDATPRLGFELGLIDPDTSEFLLIHPADTRLGRFLSRTVILSRDEPSPPVLALTLHARKSAKAAPIPYLTFCWGQDIRGRHLTVWLDGTGPVRSWGATCDLGPGTLQYLASDP